ncbi:DUF4192 domain-containing protein [Arthrobacter echini]|uniref:DUF4192 domain-containing protein n=1 Tax=Arthrobacter echini TaxID=1529066 RepID=A0A4S5E7C6_9MICC|nr:DUF4192 domain-containing protein [Arthrobacter echini]THJ67515.1 DUF4192 domain-containing protein [Arthrobacter echini]
MSSSTSPSQGSPAPRLSITSPADILAYVPHALGFVPRESLVVLTTAARRLGATLRVDLPDEQTDALSFARGVLGFVQGDTGADGTLVIVYTQRAWPRRAFPPFHDIVLRLDAVLTAAGMPVRAGWLASDSVWRDYFCADEQCCPWPGNPLDSVVHSVLNAELVFGGSSFERSAPEAALRGAPALSGTGTNLPETVRIMVEDARERYAASCRGQWQSPVQFEATSNVWDAVVDGPPLELETEAGLAGYLLASIESRTVRDFLLVSACLGSPAALAGCGAWALQGREDADEGLTGVVPVDTLRAVTGSGMPAAGASPLGPESGCGAAMVCADVLAGRYGGPIAWARVDAMSALLARLAEVSSGQARASALTMSAWFEYARGRGSRATVFLEAADAAVPGYRLARLLHELVRRGGLPAWARSRATAWTAGEGASGTTRD